jgi:hypothetical protein
METKTMKDHVEERDRFRNELKALAEKHHMGVVSFFERKDYATKTDIDTAHSMLVYNASRADMASFIQALIDEYPELTQILLLGQRKKLRALGTAFDPLSDVLKTLMDALGAGGKDEPEVATKKAEATKAEDKKPDVPVKAGVICMDSEDLPPAVREFLENMLKKAG